MTLPDLLREALAGLRLRRSRSILTALGFAVGAGAAVALGAVASGARAEILARFDSLGLNVVRVRAVTARKGEPPPLTLGDARALEESFPFVVRASPVRIVGKPVRLADGRRSIVVVGTDEALFSLRGDRFRRGRPFTPDEARRGDAVCVIGAAAARPLGIEGDALGALANVGGSWYRVVGILRESAETLSIGGGDSGREVYVPIAATLRRDRGERQAVHEVVVQVDEGVQPEAAAEAIRRSLARRRGGAERFEVKTAAALLRESRATRGVLDRLLLVVGALALVVGGLGALALAWQGALERRREIAIRRALGARRIEIAGQFVLEGVALAALGGAAGTLVGAAAAAILARALGWPWQLEPATLGLALLLPLVVAWIATSIPAWSAARVDPVAALRFEE